MRHRKPLLLLACLLLGASLLWFDLSCTKKKSTDELLADLKSGEEKDRIIAVRLLQNRKGDAAKVVPSMIAALKDPEVDIRWSAAIGLGYYGAEAKEAIPALQESQKDPDARVREAASVALNRIDPEQFLPYKGKR